MNRWSNVFLGLVMALGLGACVREKLPDCPPMQVTLTVKDKNYFNIDDAVKLGLAERKADDLPFRDYIHTLYYVVHDAEGRVVAEQKNTEVTGDAQTQVVSLPVELPYGTYTVTVWGNMKSEEPLGDNPTSAELEETGAAFNEVNLASGTFHYAYGKENHELALERTKGNLLIKAEGIPDNIDFSTKEVSDIYAVIDAAFRYSGNTRISTELDWDARNEMQSNTLMCPSPSYEGSTLGVTFIDKSAAAAVGRAEVESAVLKPQDVHITMGRNEITILKYVYNTAEDGFNIFLRVNDRWEQIHSMVVD